MPFRARFTKLPVTDNQPLAPMLVQLVVQNIGIAHSFVHNPTPSNPLCELFYSILAFRRGKETDSKPSLDVRVFSSEVSAVTGNILKIPPPRTVLP